MREHLTFDSTDGLSLEAELDGPPSGEPRAVLVFCHPHPKMGGTMNAPLLMAVRDELVGRGWAVLRFNFRGIGASEGVSSTGVDEVADADGAVAFASSRFPELELAIAGWSFGGAVALRTASRRPELTACVTVAPAIEPKPEVTAGAPPPQEFTYQGPVLVICGVNDDQVSPADCRRWAGETGATYEEMKGANHFFWAKYEPLARTVADFLDQAQDG
jgi:alpha/beta superfamily hydrolase